MVGEPVDRGLVDQRVDAGLLVEGEQLAGSLVAVSVHPWCGKAVGQCWQPCLRRARVESAKTGSVAPACRHRPAPSAYGRAPPPVGVSFAQNRGIFRIGITRTDQPPWVSPDCPVRRGLGGHWSRIIPGTSVPCLASGRNTIADRRTDER